MADGALNSGYEQPGCLRLPYATERAGALRLPQNFGILIESGDDDGNLWSGPHDLPGRFKAVAAGHDGIHDDNIRMQRFGSLYGFVAIGSFAADLPSIFGFQKMA